MRVRANGKPGLGLTHLGHDRTGLGVEFVVAIALYQPAASVGVPVQSLEHKSLDV